MALRQIERIEYDELTDTNQCGIYGIYANNKLLYIGQSTQMEMRWKAHTSYIVSGRLDYGGNMTRQSALHFLWDNGFHITFKIMCVCAPEELDQAEREYIFLYQPMLNITHNPNPIPAPEKTPMEHYHEWYEYMSELKQNKGGK